MLRVMYREYTTDGRFVMTGEFLTLPEFLGEDLSALYDMTNPAVDAAMILHGHMQPGEALKRITPLNVMVFENGKLVKHH